MRAYLDKLSADLAEQYKLYIETFMFDLWCDHGFIEFRVGFALRSEPQAKERSIMEIEDHIDEAIATQGVATS